MVQRARAHSRHYRDVSLTTRLINRNWAAGWADGEVVLADEKIKPKLTPMIVYLPKSQNNKETPKAPPPKGGGCVASGRASLSHSPQHGHPTVRRRQNIIRPRIVWVIPHSS